MTEHNPADEPDDFDDELELEPIDPEILEHQRRRTIEKTRAAEDSIDISELHRESETSDPVDFGEIKNFRFSIRHLLIATAALSVVMTVQQLTDGCTAVLAAIATTVAAGWWYVIRSERRQRAQREQAYAELRAKIAAQRAAEDGGVTLEVAATPAPPASITIPIDEPYREPRTEFSFSLKEMFGAFTVAAVLMGLVQVVGGPQNAAMLLGLIALSGLVLHAVGFDPPQVVILSWWLLLVLYLIVSTWAAFADDQAKAPPPRADSYAEVLV
ncbi:MAG: hypothetical protein KDA57_04010 [Planctomycetales bacterium]|nr:hypothetical protein [Planctomycetales bacterium]